MPRRTDSRSRGGEVGGNHLDTVADCCLQGFVSSAGNLIEVFCPKTQTAGSLFLFPLFLIPGRLLYPSLTNSLANAPGDAKSETAAEVGKHR